ncbi:hypothetical protein GWK47_005964 [Chionoecetes opilio]|uniref:Uncharacterized protein n=1 Tax=Chionoecetes opilio TaxID=41210 RepID=A0A8J4Y8F7_CHIOP|nr:hypothetical protein GWK47_005964 [Chionoecetes opilio]
MSDTWAASTVETGVQEGGRRRGGRANQGQERTLSDHPGGPTSLRPGCPKPGQEALEGRLKARATLEEGLWTVAGPERKPRPRAPDPKAHPTGTTRILGAINTGVNPWTGPPNASQAVDKARQTSDREAGERV